MKSSSDTSGDPQHMPRRLRVPRRSRPLTAGFAIALAVAALVAGCSSPTAYAPIDPAADEVLVDDGSDAMDGDEGLDAAATIASTGPRLRYPPPTGWQNYRVIHVHTHNDLPRLDDSVNYRLVMPTTPRRRPLTINGGRNVVIIGGEIDLDVPVRSGNTESAHRGIYIVGGTVQGRVIHVEGLLIHSRNGSLSDGFHISRGRSGNHFIVQIQNVRVGPLPRPYFGGTRTHPDLIQTWGSVGELRIDRFTGISNYQGIFLKADFNGRHGNVHLSNVNLRGDRDGRFLLWMSDNSGGYPRVTLNGVWIQPAPNRSFGNTVWPAVGTSSTSARLYSGEIGWPNLPVTGRVRQGVPSGGDIVPSGRAGLRYVSPGYQ